MPREIKVATFNAEWMINLFVKDQPTLLKEHTPKSPGLGSKPKDPQGVANRIASVISDLDADIVGICEGPPLKSQMKRFVKEKLGGEYEVFSMEDGTQSVHNLIHKRLSQGVTIDQLPRSDKVFERLEKTRLYYKYGDVQKSYTARMARLPVVLRITRKGKVTELMTLHTKSKISKLKKAKQWAEKSTEEVIDAINSRQKLSMEMDVIRKYIAHRLYSEAAESVIVMGDLNDGVSRDVVDDTYLLHSIVHELRGAFHHEQALMRHVLTPRQLQTKSYAWTVEFRDATNEGKSTKILLDHILFSPNCLDGGKICFVPESGCIEHEVFNKHVQGKGNNRDDRPSDHIPLSARFELR